MRKKERAQGVIRIFDEIYPEVKCTLEYSTPIEMLIATQLSAQCTDARVNIVTKDLFKKYKSVSDFAAADLSELEEDIRSTGFYKNKAKNIKSCCKTVCRSMLPFMQEKVYKKKYKYVYFLVLFIKFL